MSILSVMIPISQVSYYLVVKVQVLVWRYSTPSLGIAVYSPHSLLRGGAILWTATPSVVVRTPGPPAPPSPLASGWPARCWARRGGTTVAGALALVLSCWEVTTASPVQRQLYRQSMTQSQALPCRIKQSNITSWDNARVKLHSQVHFESKRY